MNWWHKRQSVMFIRSTGEPVLAQVVGHSEHGDAYRRITYDRDGKTVLHDRASVWRLSARVGDRHLVTIPQGMVGDRLPWGGERQGGGRILDCSALLIVQCLWEGGVFMQFLWPVGFLSLGSILGGGKTQAPSWCMGRKILSGVGQGGSLLGGLHS